MAGEDMLVTLFPGEAGEWDFDTNGYTFDLLSGAGQKFLKFSIVFFLGDEIVAGPYSATLPDAKPSPREKRWQLASADLQL